MTAERDELGRVTRYEYADGLHLVSRRINPDGSQLRYRYDNARLLLTQIENERGELYRLDYHPNGLISRETGFDGRSCAYAYDLSGHLLEKTEYGEDGSELITRYQRDAASRLLVKTQLDQIRAPKHVTEKDPEPAWSDGRLRLRFNTLQLYESGRPRVSIPYSYGGKGDKLEPFTEVYPDYDKGGALGNLYPRQVRLLILKWIRSIFFQSNNCGYRQSGKSAFKKIGY